VIDMAQDGKSEETSATTSAPEGADAAGEPAQAEPLAATDDAAREEPAAPEPSEERSGERSTPPVDVAAETPSSPAPDDTERAMDSSPSIEVHGETEGETLGATEPQPEPLTESERSIQAPGAEAAKAGTVLPSDSPVAMDVPKAKHAESRKRRPRRRTAESQPAPAAGMSRFDKRIVLALLVGIALASLLVLLPRKALLTISATGSGDRSLENLKVLVDGQLKCEKSPCAAGDLRAGEHTIRVSGDDFGTAERVVAMRSGADHTVDFVLDRSREVLAATAQVPSATGSAEPTTEARSAENQAHGATARSGKAHWQVTGTIKANSIPLSDVLVDGRVVGKTPTNVSAAPGLHTVIFIHPDYGRREVLVQVKPNQDAVAAVRFRRSSP
jgi:hypothetical protein